MGMLVKLLQEPRTTQKKQRVHPRAQAAGQLLFFTGVRYSRIEDEGDSQTQDKQEPKSANGSVGLEQRERLSDAILD